MASSSPPASPPQRSEDVILRIWVIPEWREHYVPYAVLLDEIELLVRSVPEIHQVSKHKALIRRRRAADAHPGSTTLLLHHNQTFSGTEMLNRTFAMLNDDDNRDSTSNGHDLATTMRSRRGIYEEELNRSFTFVGTPTTCVTPSDSGGRKHFRIYAEVVLTDELQLCISYIEYRAGRRLVQESCTGFTIDGTESFPSFDALDTPGFLDDDLRHQQIGHNAAHFLVRTLHEANAITTAAIRSHVKKVVAFYSRKSLDVAGVAFALCELGSRLSTMHPRDRSKVERLFRRTHFTIQMLQEFCDHNRLIVSKLIEHYVHSTHQVILSLDALEHLMFFSHPHSGPLALLELTIVKNFATLFCEDQEDDARERLKLAHVSERKKTLTKPKMLLEAGLLAGLIIGFGVACVVLYSYAVEEYQELQYTDSDLFMFGVSGIFILLAFLFALDVVVWEYFEINFVFSLHLNPVQHFGGLQLVRDQLQYALVWIVLLFCFMHAALEESIMGTEYKALNTSATALVQLTRDAASASSDPACSSNLSAVADRMVVVGHPSHYLLYGRSTLHSWVWAYSVFPCLAVVYIVHAVLGRHKDDWLSRTLWRLLWTPYFPVEFPDFFVCEQLVSLSTTLFEIQFLWCAFHSDDVEGACRSAKGDGYWLLLVLPAVWRVLQSFRRYRDEPFQRSFYPHLLNATKYLNNCVAYSFYALVGVSKFEEWSSGARNTVLVIFFVTFVVDMCFKCWYELWIEFGVLRWDAKHFLIRDEILLPQWSYYAATATNVVLRCLWIVKYFTEKVWATDSRWTFPVFAIAEVVRRAVWNIFRVEHDQVSNIESYKLVKFAPMTHHDAPPKALWDVNLEHLKKGIPECARAAEFFQSAKEFFRCLSRRERIKLLKDLSAADELIPTVPTTGGDGEPTSSHEPIHPGNVTPRRQQSSEHRRDEEDSHPGASPRPRGRERCDFVRDPRTGAMKTTLMLFAEMYEEDRARALLFHMNGRSLQAYLDDLIAAGDLDAAYLTELDEAVAAPRPQRSTSSFVLRRPSALSAAAGEPSRPSLLLRRPHIVASEGIAPVSPIVTTEE